jgi:NAD-dependent deacetylase
MPASLRIRAGLGAEMAHRVCAAETPAADAAERPRRGSSSPPGERYVGGVRVTVCSGAGISAESGVPTFRDDKDGLWARFDPYELSSIDGWLQHPERIWGWYLWRHHLVSRVEPNDGHRAIAAWQDHAEVSVVTQNVDNLHERAGSRPVHHLHGNMSQFRCADCGRPYDGRLPEMDEPALEVEPPTCPCGGLIRPDVVWFGEALPASPWQCAVEAIENAEVLVVVGTSGIVYPAAGLPELAISRGTPVIEVNPQQTPLSGMATATVRESASSALPRLLQRLPSLLG